MSLHALRKGHRVKIGASEFLILQRLTEGNWQLQNTVTGEWCTFHEDDLLDRFAKKELSFVVRVEGSCPPTDRLAEKLTRDLSAYPPELVAVARNRMPYRKRSTDSSQWQSPGEPLSRLCGRSRSESMTSSPQAGARSVGTTASG